MTSTVQLTTGSYKATTSVHFYQLDLLQASNVMLDVSNDNGTSGIYDSNMQYVGPTTNGTPQLLQAGSYIVKASYSSLTYGVMNVYIPSQASFNSLLDLASGTYRASTYDNFYALNLGSGGQVFLVPSGDNANAVIYDTSLNFIAYAGDAPIYLENGNYVVVASFNGFRNGTLNVSIPLSIWTDKRAIDAPPLLGGNNVFYGSDYADLVQGLDGNDTFTGYFHYSRPDAFFGGDGIDTAVYRGIASDYSIRVNESFKDLRKPDGVLINGVSVSDPVRYRDGIDHLHSVERLKFADTNVALDLDGNAGTVAKILGAVFGREAVANEEFVGIGLYYIDGGMTYESLMQLAIDVRLGASASHPAIVDLLYTNVVGLSPLDADRDYFVGLLTDGTFSVAGLGVMAADIDINLNNIKLVGLSQQGLEYVSYLGE